MTSDYTNKQIKEIIGKHKLWLDNKDGGVRANFDGSNLTNVNLRGTNLDYASLVRVKLDSADLEGASFVGANFDYASLVCVKLNYANLDSASFVGTNLGYANLVYAKLDSANLNNASFVSANLDHSSLKNAFMDSVNLDGASLECANLGGVKLDDVCLYMCSGNREEIKSLFIFEAYGITYTAKHLQIGCEKHEITKWWEFDDERIMGMDGKEALKFWRKYKEFIKSAIELSPAIPTVKKGYLCARNCQ